MGFKDRLANANAAARQVREEGAEAKERTRTKFEQAQQRIRDEHQNSGRQKFSDVAEDGRCPNCGGQSFTAKRSKKGKLGVGVLAPKTQVKCDTCGTMFKRG